MDSAARRWAELLDGWIIPDEVLFQAPEDPWAVTPAAVVPPWNPDDSPARQAALEVLPPDGSVLDVGCGAGAASLALVPPAGSVVGVDPSQAMLDAFVTGCRARRVKHRAVLEDWPAAAASVDAADGAAALSRCRDICAQLPEGLHYRTEGGAGQLALLSAFEREPEVDTFG